MEITGVAGGGNNNQYDINDIAVRIARVRPKSSCFLFILNAFYLLFIDERDKERTVRSIQPKETTEEREEVMDHSIADRTTASR